MRRLLTIPAMLFLLVTACASRADAQKVTVKIPPWGGANRIEGGVHFDRNRNQLTWGGKLFIFNKAVASNRITARRNAIGQYEIVWKPSRFKVVMYFKPLDRKLHYSVRFEVRTGLKTLYVPGPSHNKDFNGTLPAPWRLRGVTQIPGQKTTWGVVVTNRTNNTIRLQYGWHGSKWGFISIRPRSSLRFTKQSTQRPWLMLCVIDPTARRMVNYHIAPNQNNPRQRNADVTILQNRVGRLYASGRSVYQGAWNRQRRDWSVLYSPIPK